MSRIIDFHSHMLPGIDDGSHDAQMSAAMLSLSRGQGIEAQVLTPHFYRWREDIPSFAKRRAAALDRLLEALPPDAPQLYVGSETAYFPHMSETDLSALCIRGTNVLLIEMPFESWEGDVEEEIASLILDRGLEIVLAHVERFLSYRGNAERLQRLSKLPIHMQANAEIFLHFSSRGQALRLVRSGMVTILGSDTHNLSDRRPDLGPARELLQKRLGAQALADLDQSAEMLLREAVAE